MSVLAFVPKYKYAQTYIFFLFSDQGRDMISMTLQHMLVILLGSDEEKMLTGIDGV